MVREDAVGTLHDLTPLQRTRIEELARVYGAPFEVGYLPETALLNYVLDRFRKTACL